jgi:hypothetical protein
MEETRSAGGYSITVRADDQLLTMILLDEFLSDYAVAEVGLLLEIWRVGQTMRWAGPSQRVVVTARGLRSVASHASDGGR